MATNRGYTSYRGRGSKLKILLAIVLGLIILATIGMMLMQRYVVYDASGTPRMQLPWMEDAQTEPSSQTPPEVNLTLQSPGTDSGEALHALDLSAAPMTDALWKASEAAQAGAPYNAAVFLLKAPGGTVYFDATGAVNGAVKTEADTTETLRTVGATSLHAVARLSCFADSRAANADVEGMGLKNTGGFIFYDGTNAQWLDPGKSAARAYLCALAGEAEQLGFDEILLTDVTYPTVGKLDKIDYGENGKSQNLTAFLTEMRAALGDGVILSVELPEAVILSGSDNFAGQSLSEIAAQVDRIYAKTSPEQVQALSDAVTAANPKTGFVPELQEASAEGSYLLVS